ncbi:hypothetical protein V6N11_006183 [Hibiscus sabdariffa]|uniref:Uncharacterized protein n=1 Tax=Hibiscus sabdariffa TaxID=183260 RepID=A0ABR2RQ18_9ROSI
MGDDRCLSLVDQSGQLRSVHRKGHDKHNGAVPGAVLASTVWSPPDVSWVKIKTDGTPPAIDGFVSCSGVF